MIHLRSTNISGLERGARLRELFGDLDGARELWQSAVRLAPAGDERDWILTQMASLDRRTGHMAVAVSLLEEVLRSQPRYQPALAEMARIEMDRRNYSKAAEMLAARYQSTHRPDAQYELARALEMAGRTEEGAAQYREFESAALAASVSPYNYDHELVFFYVDHEKNPKEALRIAALDAGKRQDVATLDAYAWALFANGQLPEAGKQMAKALAVGVREPDILYRAGLIAAKLNDSAAASRYLNASLAVSSESAVADAVRAALKELAPHAD
jgi:Tfp pilus assembly protein PilF